MKSNGIERILSTTSRTGSRIRRSERLLSDGRLGKLLVQVPLGAVLGAACAVIVSAQETVTHPESAPLPAPLGTIVWNQPVETPMNEAREISEDLEVFRRILHRDLSALYGSTPVDAKAVENARRRGAAAEILNAAPGRPTIDDPLATWVPGAGVFFQMEVPPPAAEPSKEATDPIADCPYISKPEWERVRMEVTGEIRDTNCRTCHAGGITGVGSIESANRSAEARDFSFYLGYIGREVGAPQAARPTRDRITTALVNTLAQHGHNLRRVDANGVVAIGITFSEPSPRDTSRPLRSSTLSGALERMYSDGPVPLALDMKAPSPDGPRSSFTPGESQQQSRGAGRADADELKSNELAGDLAMRQSNWHQAIATYYSALRETGAYKKVRTPGSDREVDIYIVDVESVQPEHRETVARIAAKLAQAWLGAGNVGIARPFLEYADALLKGQGSMPTHSSAEAGLPVRLVLSVRMQALRAIADGTLPREEFGKQVRINWIRPSSAKAPRRQQPRPVRDHTSTPEKGSR